MTEKFDAVDFARSSVITAVDQVSTFDNIDDALASHFENLRTTCAEYRVPAHEQSEAEAVYLRLARALGMTSY